MELSELLEIHNTKTIVGRPSSTLTNIQWQEELKFRKLYITPYDKPLSRISGKYSRGFSDKLDQNGNTVYTGITNWQVYCSYINDVLKNIRKGQVDYCYFAYQVLDLLKFHFDELCTKYRDGYWEVWLEN